VFAWRIERSRHEVVTKLVIRAGVRYAKTSMNTGFGEPGRNRTFNLLIKSPNTPTNNQADTALTPAECGKLLQNLQPPRNQNSNPDHVPPNPGDQLEDSDER
jgi:hypothetical protein